MLYMAGTEWLAAEGDAEPPGGILDGGLEIADGGVTAHPGAAAVGEGCESFVVDDCEDHAEGLDDDLEGEVGEDEAGSLLAGGEEGDAVGGDVEEAGAEIAGEGGDGEGGRGGGRGESAGG